MHRVTINSDSAPAAVGPYSHAVRVSGELLFISGQIPLHPATGEIVGDTPGEQARRCLENLEMVAADAGTSLRNAVKMTVYLTDIAAFAEVNEVYADFFKHDPPARVALAVAALPRGAQVEIDAVVAVEV
ncbi:Rid family detoxifying hydrolase [Conexibacter sp. S30A1]|uniref:Rid family detoxifying hydrolase n=1 Tax=Conexibacter sp. S30A1 TaxID=2937800 RepID=UPI00200D9B4E|nr:Rid family detoxifying hydrolase [Conexibacter sp. S30A1]